MSRLLRLAVVFLIEIVHGAEKLADSPREQCCRRRRLSDASFVPEEAFEEVEHATRGKRHVNDVVPDVDPKGLLADRAPRLLALRKDPGRSQKYKKRLRHIARDRTMEIPPSI
jgi:hypothetical protein